MNASLFASVSDVWLLAGWTMIHFVWLGTLAALAAFALRVVLRRTSANVRYATALASLVLLAALPASIALWLHVNPLPLKGGIRGGTESIATVPTSDAPSKHVVSSLSAASPNESVLNQTAVAVPARSSGSIAPAPAVAVPVAAASELSPNTSLTGRGDVLAKLETCIPYLPWLWLIGTPITFAVTATGIIGTRRLRRSCRPIVDGPIAEAAARLAASLRIAGRVTVAVCDRIAAPVLIGILRPIILMPPAALTGYSPDEIEMVLLHELAHVRRWDNLVNLLQRIVESLLFFHPAVWLISSWARREREACCDALVVSRTDHPHAYAELLVALAAQMPRSVLFHPAASSAMAAGPLRARIRRILKLDDDPMLVSGKSFTIVLAGLITAAALATVYLPKVGHAEPSATEGTRKAKVEAKAKLNNLNARDELVNRLKSLNETTRRKYEEYLDAAKGTGQPNTTAPDPEMELLLRDIAEMNAKVNELTTTYLHLQSDYVVVRRELGDQPTQQLTQRFAEHCETLQKQLVVASQKLESKRKELEKHLEKSADLSPQERELEELQRSTNDIVDKLAVAPTASNANDDSEKAERERFEHFEKSLKTVEIVIAVFNDSAGYSSQLETVYNSLIKDHHSLYLWGLTVDADSPDVKRYHLTGAPTCIVFRSGKEASRLAPIKSAEELKQFVNLAVGARKVTVKPDGSMVAQGIESWNALPKAKDAQKDSLDNWPLGVPFPSPKEGEIAMRAWQEWKLKVIPAGAGETLGENSTGIKVVGGITLPPNFDAPVYLSKFGGVDAKDFNRLDAALKVSKGAPYAVVECVSNTAQGPVTVSAYFNPPHNSKAPPVAKIVALPKPEAAGEKNAKFPSLEVQKMADLAYKRLGLELEAISDDDLNRVRAAGYGGGVKVTDVRFHGADQEIEIGDILVGLHVWPTTNLEEVATVLERNDLAELDPLKFYAVRAGVPQSGAIQSAQNATDHVVTGRIALLETAAHQSADVQPALKQGVQDQQQPQSSNYAAPGADRYMPNVAINLPYAAPAFASPAPVSPVAPLAPPTNRYNVDPARASEQSPLAGPRPSTLDPRPADPYQLPEQSPLSGPRPSTLDPRPTEHSLLANQTLADKRLQACEQQLAAAMALKELALTASNQAKGEEAIAAAKRDLDDANRQLDEAKQAFDDAKRKVEAANKSNEERAITEQRVKALTQRVAACLALKEVAAANFEHEQDRQAREAAKRELDAANVQLDEAKRALDKAKWQLEQYPRKRPSASSNPASQPPAGALRPVPADGSPSGPVVELRENRLTKPMDDWTAVPTTQFAPGASSQSSSPPPIAVAVMPSAPNTPPKLPVAPTAPAAPRPSAVLTFGPAYPDLPTLSTTLTTPTAAAPGGRFDPAAPAPANFEIVTTSRPGPDGKLVYEQHAVPRTAAAPASAPTAPSTSPTSPVAPNAVTAAAQSATAVDKQLLRYDGKSFGEWRHACQIELSVEKRIEAVKALAAFGANGYGKEAAEAILDVAGEYDFSTIDSETTEGKFKQTVISELAPDDYRRQTLAPLWLPDLVARVHKDPKRWSPLAGTLIYNLRSDDKEVLATLRRLAASDDSNLRLDALGALVRNYNSTAEGAPLDETTQKLIDRALESKKSDVIISTLYLLKYAPSSAGGGLVGGRGDVSKLLYIPPALTSLVFNSDENVRRVARETLACIDDNDAPPIVNQLLTVLNDKSRQRDHIEAMRALSALGEKAKEARPELLNILNASNDPAVTSAAFVAAFRSAGQSVMVGDLGKKQVNWRALESVFGTLTEDRLRTLEKKYGSPEFTKRLEHEEDAIFPEYRRNLSGGGFF